MDVTFEMLLLATAGGVAIGLAATMLFATLGRVAGISGIFARAMMRPFAESWPLAFVVGLGAGAWAAFIYFPFEMPDTIRMDPMLIGGGLLVGFGTRLGSGCTSGHGVCGMARLSRRSIVATLTFMAVGVVTATVVGAL